VLQWLTKWIRRIAREEATSLANRGEPLTEEQIRAIVQDELTKRSPASGKEAGLTEEQAVPLTEAQKELAGERHFDIAHEAFLRGLAEIAKADGGSAKAEGHSLADAELNRLMQERVLLARARKAQEAQRQEEQIRAIVQDELTKRSPAPGKEAGLTEEQAVPLTEAQKELARTRDFDQAHEAFSRGLAEIEKQNAERVLAKVDGKSAQTEGHSIFDAELNRLMQERCLLAQARKAQEAQRQEEQIRAIVRDEVAKSIPAHLTEAGMKKQSEAVAVALANWEQESRRWLQSSKPAAEAMAEWVQDLKRRLQSSR
jgi:hypothetical protein